jgi:hypothetical protein
VRDSAFSAAVWMRACDFSVSLRENNTFNFYILINKGSIRVFVSSQIKSISNNFFKYPIII